MQVSLPEALPSSSQCDECYPQALACRIACTRLMFAWPVSVPGKPGSPPGPDMAHTAVLIISAQVSHCTLQSSRATPRVAFPRLLGQPPWAAGSPRPRLCAGPTFLCGLCGRGAVPGEFSLQTCLPLVSSLPGGAQTLSRGL